MQPSPGKTLAQALVLIIFLLTLGIASLGTILAPKKDVSVNEKRRLAQFPPLAWNIPSLTTWPKTFENYLRDHFFHRETLVRWNALARLRLFRHSPTFVALVGKDDWLFYVGDWALHDYLGDGGGMEPERIERWADLINRRRQRLETLGVHYLLAVAPNKEKVYPEYLPERIRRHAGTTRLEALGVRMRTSDAAAHFLDLSDVLRQGKDEKQTYFKTDTHWTDPGAFIAYLEIMRRLHESFQDIKPIPRKQCTVKRQQSCGEDIALVMGLAGAITEECEKITVRQACASQKGTLAEFTALPPAMRNLPVFGCPQATPLRLLVLSDSFGNALRDYLAESFQEVVFFREGSLFTLAPFIEEYRPDIILELHVARFLDKAMQDRP